MSDLESNIMYFVLGCVFNIVFYEFFQYLKGRKVRKHLQELIDKANRNLQELIDKANRKEEG